MDPARSEDRLPYLAFVFKAGALAALLATFASALMIAVFTPLTGGTVPNAWSIAKTTLLLCPITAVSCGSYGLLAGIAGGAFLNLRRRRVQSTKRLLIESAIAGFLLGFFFPLFDRAMNPPSLSGMQILLSAPIGMCCALVCALTFRNRFVKEPIK
jgi:hypothetical protein